MAIIGTHLLVYTPEAEAVRKTLADVFQFESIDSGNGWLIFRMPPAELGVHPSQGATPHEISFMCDDLESTMAELRDRGLEFQSRPKTEEWGTSVKARLPGGLQVLIYQPAHELAISD